MTYGLQLFNPDGSLSFDSNLAVGGVCLGIFTVAAMGGSSFAFPDYVTHGGYALATGRTIAAYSYSIDHALGYLRFNFGSAGVEQSYALFAK